MSVASDPVEVDRVSGALWALGCAGVEERPGRDGVELVAAFDDESRARIAVEALRAQGASAPTIEAADADAGLDAWRAWAQPVQAGPTWVVPAWGEAPPLAAGERVLWIDPGPTFGSGSHPTTQLVLALAEQLVRPGDTVLDVGCGSGVLAIAAATSGAHATAIDIDPAAPDATAANAARNGVAALVEASTTPLAELASDGARFDLVLANLLAPTIAELRDALLACTAPSGRLVVSGLLADRWPATAALLHPLDVEQTEELEGWVAVVLRWPRERIGRSGSVG